MNDLAAARLVEGLAKSDAELVLQALDLVERAISSDPRLVEAHFNRALALEFLGPSSLACAAWDDYLRVDTSTPWAVEARQHRHVQDGRVQEALAAGDQSRQRGRQFIEEDLLLQWANAVSANSQTEAASVLTRAEATAGQMKALNDTYASDLVHVVEQSNAEGRAGVMAEAYHDGQEARRLIVEGNQIESARVLLARAQHLVSHEEAFAEYLDYWWLLTEWYRGRPEAIEAPLRTLIQKTSNGSHGYLEARSRVLLGSVLYRLARYSDAIDSYQRGVERLEMLGEHDAEAASRMLLAGALRDQGLWRDAWRNELAAITRLDALKAFGARHNVIREAIRLALVRRQTEVASVYLDLLESDAHRWGDSGARFTVAFFRSRIELQRGRREASAAALADAERLFEAIQDVTFKQSYRLDLAMLRAEVLVNSDPDRAVASAQALIADSAESGALFRRVHAYALLGQASAAAGREDVAIDAWQRGIAALEDDSQRVREERARIARTNDVWTIYDDLVRTLVARQHQNEALAAAERGRSRALLDAVSRNVHASGVRTPVPIGDLPQVVIYYVTFADRSLIWVLNRGTTTFHQSPGGDEAIAALLKTIEAASQTGDDPTESLRELYRLLIEPIAALIPAGAPITLIPDSSLAAVPFAALVSPESARFLIEDHELTLSPSLELTQIATARLRERPLRIERGLAAGDATIGDVDLRLPPLPGARAEVEAIARVYQTQPLVGEALSSAAFLGRVRGSDVVHFAGHAVADAEFPSRSFLALAGTGDIARLSANRITAEVFGQVQLVALSACSTGSGTVERGEGVLSLARPFLAVGVPFVVATLRPVGDNVGPLLVDFHERLHAGQRPAQALQLAQLHAIAQNRTVNLRGWAAFTLFGGMTAK